MANRKKEVYKPKPMTEGKRNLIQGLLQEYDIQSAEDIQDALKDLLSGTIQDMLETEMDDHLGYDNTLSTPYFYFDLKMGIHRNAFILKENANQEIEKKFRKKELYRRYWKLYIEDYGIVIDENANEFLIDGICQRILRYSLKYMQEMNKEDKLASIQVCDPIETVWNQIGEQVYCWGCVGGRIAV